jgi:hypothetical protein
MTVSVLPGAVLKAFQHTLRQHWRDISCGFLDTWYTKLERRNEGDCTCTGLVYSRTFRQ